MGAVNLKRNREGKRNHRRQIEGSKEFIAIEFPVCFKLEANCSLTGLIQIMCGLSLALRTANAAPRPMPLGDNQVPVISVVVLFAQSDNVKSGGKSGGLGHLLTLENTLHHLMSVVCLFSVTWQVFRPAKPLTRSLPNFHQNGGKTKLFLWPGKTYEFWEIIVYPSSPLNDSLHQSRTGNK